ncbi:DUF4861 family protein [Pseudoduganella aquatica]|uniref:DUF4861 family protein n=1 Tax=Pseudoduganella aquatica TaxID=2660641 RepID=UPI001E56F975|nr:DUF4861 family protein [Pseudoduganella aquatica]
MKMTTTPLLAAMLATLAPMAHGASFTVKLSHDLDIARPSETVTIPWVEVNKQLPGALIQRLAVKDASGRVVPHQVTNVAPQAKDPKNEGVAYGELIFQHSFKAGEKTASYTVETIDALAPPFASQSSARYVPERLDDFAWENDKLAHRTYGPALAAPAAPGSGKEVLETSGLDLWFKRVNYPIVDRWYNKGHDHYHHDEGEGMDMYNVGKSRGAGGAGVWLGGTLYTSSNYASWKVLANGPVRTIFELNYSAWNANGTQVSEVKRFTVDAGHYMDRVDSTFTFAGPKTLPIAIGLNKTPTDKGEDPKIAVVKDKASTAVLQWIQQATKGSFGVAMVLPSATDYTEDKLNELIVANATSGQPLTYYVGGAWERSGDITSQAQWEAYVHNVALRARNPVKVSWKQ